ncbi:MAG: hypothetical protein AAF494_14410 [Pseudomonadota bacterium]
MFSQYLTPAISSLLAMSLVACAGDSERYPSLAVRDVERLNGEFSTSAPASMPAELPEPISQTRSVDALMASAEISHAKFMAAVPNARAMLNRAQSSAGNQQPNPDTLVALSKLAALRGETAIALSELDLLAADTAMRFETASQVEAARMQVLTFVSEQDRTLNRLWSERAL